MATIALYAGKLNQMPGLINDARKSVDKLKTELFDLQEKAYNVDTSVCDLSEVISSIQASAQTQENRIAVLESFQANSEEFIREVIRIDNHVADTVNQNKDDFYKQYEYLKPDSEKSWLQIALEDAGEWCEEHWKELVMTVVIVAGAVLAVVAVVCTGGVALAPMLAAGFTALGVASGTALTAATVISFVVAGVAVTSTIASSTLNLIDLWGDMSGNSTFQAWKTAMNWTSMISNGFYSVGAFFNSAHGISNAALREYSHRYLSDPSFRNAISQSTLYNLNPQTGSSIFWTGMRDNGGQQVAIDYAGEHGGNSLEMLMEQGGITPPGPGGNWKPVSASLALNSSGEVKVLIGSSPWSGSVWNTVESPILNILPGISGITSINIINNSILYAPRVFEISAMGYGMSSLFESLISLFISGE